MAPEFRPKRAAKPHVISFFLTSEEVSALELITRSYGLSSRNAAIRTLIRAGGSLIEADQILIDEWKNTARTLAQTDNLVKFHAFVKDPFETANKETKQTLEGRGVFYEPELKREKKTGKQNKNAPKSLPSVHGQPRQTIITQVDRNRMNWIKPV